MKIIREFFVSTKSRSVYRVWCEGDNFVGRIEKIFSNKKTDSDIGRRFTIGEMDFADGSNYIGIGKVICFYYGSSRKGIRPPAELVNYNRWGGHTSLIVALFLNESEAKECIASRRLKPYDKRWKEQTKEVTTRIDNDHPRFVLGTGT